MNISRKSIISIAIALVLIFILVGIAGIEFDRGLVRKKIALVKTELQYLNDTLMSYTIDYNRFPPPDIDVEGNKVISYRLTTPINYIVFIFSKPTIRYPNNRLPHDPFNQHGKRLYHYAPTKVDGNYWDVTAMILSSYGPDEVSGYGTTKFNLEHYVLDSAKNIPEWVDKDSISPYPLKTSPFTYDPTNGLISGGDIWNRGP